MSKGVFANIILVIGPGIFGKNEKVRLACIVTQDAYVRTVLLRNILLRKTFIYNSLQPLLISGTWVLQYCCLLRRSNTRYKHHDCPVGSEWLIG
jgi:hypothetical protein